MGANKILLAEQLAFGASGSAFLTELNPTVYYSPSTPYVLPAGWWFVVPQTYLLVQYSPDGGSTWRTVYPSTFGGLVYSDGYNTRLAAASGATTNPVTTYCAGLSSGAYKILLGQQLVFGAIGSAFAAEQALSVPITTPTVLSAGCWIVEGQANLTTVYQPVLNTWRTMSPSTVGGMIFSDGQNVGLLSGSGTLTVHCANIGSLTGKILLNEQLTFGVSGSAFKAELNPTVTITSAPYTPAAGWWLVAGLANLSVAYSPDGGSTWRAFYPSTAGGMFYSDGYNVQLQSGSGAITPYCAQLA
jgi:hypothetical protein